MWIPLLKKLEQCAKLRTTKAEWRHRLGDDVFGSLGTLLEITEGKAEALPCAHRPGCGGTHEVRRLSEGRLVAVSADDERPCTSFDVSRADLAIYRFDLEAYLREIADTLTLETYIDRVGETLVLMGTLSKRRVPVFMSFASTARKHRENLAAVRAHDPEVFVFFLSHPCPELSALERDVKLADGRFSVLSSLLDVNRNGRLVASLDPSDLWPDLARDPARPAGRLVLPDGCEWKHLVVTLLDNGNVSISHHTGSAARTYTPRELKFESQHGKESLDWDALKLAAHAHYIPVREKDGERDEDARSRAKGITLKLAAVTGIEGTAFTLADSPEHGHHPRGAGRGYWPLFKLRPETERVQRGRRRLGNSPVASEPDSDDEE